MRIYKVGQHIRCTCSDFKHGECVDGKILEVDKERELYFIDDANYIVFNYAQLVNENNNFQYITYKPKNSPLIKG